MLRVVETFSGIGSQAKALKNIGIKHEVVATVEWDVNAIYAYDIIHNGPQNLLQYENMKKIDLIDELSKYTISSDGKTNLERSTLKRMSTEVLQRILAAIHRTKNHVSITDVHAINLPQNIDLITYSFPCQDLSICGAWHGNSTGINRDANNRSGMLWEIERILQEYVEAKIDLPKFLLMENVSNILSNTHRANFKEWEDYLTSIGYINKIYTLDASNFSIPQKRKRTFMLSIYTKDTYKADKINEYLDKYDLETFQIIKPKELKPLISFLRTEYHENPQYKFEADYSNPNYTPSRKKIYEENPIIYDGNIATCESINTITTKQDRNPNSGLLIYNSGIEGKAPYRNLTPRECFMLMGFDESDFQALVDNNFSFNSNNFFFTRDKLIKMAGNSIVVNVLEEIFKQIVHIKENILMAQIKKVDINSSERNSCTPNEYKNILQLSKNVRGVS